jgi:hypothetical protein
MMNSRADRLNGGLFFVFQNLLEDEKSLAMLYLYYVYKE